MSIGSYAFAGVPKQPGRGWLTLPLGAGGLVTGMHIADDGSIVCRTDVGNGYRWSGKVTDITNPNDKWIPLLTLPSLAGLSSNPKTSNAWGMLELVQAPSDATKLWAIFTELSGSTASPVYYSTDSGSTWNVSNIASQNTSTNSPVGYNKVAFYRIAADPNNSSVVYVGFPSGNGGSYGAYVATDGHTFTPITSLGQTTVGSGVCGICFDKASGTVIGIGGLTVTKHIIVPVGGTDIFESTDGGVTWVSTGFASVLGTASFELHCGVVNSNGTYFAFVNTKGIYRYKSGTWTNITPSSAGIQTILIVDPNDPNYLSSTGEQGTRYGWTTHNSEAATPTWTATTYGKNSSVTASAPDYDLPWLVDIFNSGAVDGYGLDESCMLVDNNGDTIFCGNQSIWKMPGRVEYNGATHYTWTSFGRGQEATVAQEVWKPTGGNNPVIAVQDFGLPTGGSFETRPTGYVPPYSEYTCSSVEESPTDGTFVVARITSQGGQANAPGAVDASRYSTDAGVTWTPYADFPSSVWQSNIVGNVNGSVLTVASISSGVKPFVGQEIYTASPFADKSVYITSVGSVDGSGLGTYNLNSTLTLTSQNLVLFAVNNCGQIIAVDNDHHIIVPAGYSHGTVPAYTSQAQSPTTCAWQACNGLPVSNWMFGPWFWAVKSKPIAVGFGSDVGTVWAGLGATSNSTVTIYKSTDYGANFNQASTITVSVDMTSIFLLAVPGYPGHLWMTGSFSGGSPSLIWHSEDHGSTWVQVSIAPIQLPNYLSIGAIDPQNGVYPTLWLQGMIGTVSVLYYSIDKGKNWQPFGTTTGAGQRTDLPPVAQMYGVSAVRADRQVFKKLYAGAGQGGFVWYEP